MFSGHSLLLFGDSCWFCLFSIDIVLNYGCSRDNIDNDGIDFDYNVKFTHIYCDRDSDDDDENSNRQHTNCFVSSVCFCEMRTNLECARSCLKCKGIFLRYFLQAASDMNWLDCTDCKEWFDCPCIDYADKTLERIMLIDYVPKM